MGMTIAFEGDIKATVGTTPFAPATTGTWTPGPLLHTKATAVTCQQKPALHSVSCTFQFNGNQQTANGLVPVTGSETVELQATASLLTVNNKALLRNGETKTGSHGNTLTAQVAQTLVSSD